MHPFFLTIVSTLFLASEFWGAIALHHGSDDPKCPDGTYPGFETNVWQYNVPTAEFINKTGSFFEAEWYLGSIKSTHGKDNTVGATRTAAIGNSTFTEQLVGHYRSPTQSVIRFHLHQGSLPLGGFSLIEYTEEFRVMSICAGTATYFSMTATYCTEDVVAAYDFYDKFRRGTVGAVAQELDAPVFAGTCPTVNLRRT